jgi:hypothetical protein
MPTQREKYGLNWPESTDDLQIEMTMVRKGGQWKVGDRSFGEGIIHHYEQMRKILWPWLDDHRWHRICRDTIHSSKITVLMGPGSSGKTHEAAWNYLCEYFCFPEETCVLVSSTDMRGLRLRVWGEMTMLWQKAVEKFPYLSGHLLDSKIAITTDDIDDGEFDERNARDLRKGIIGIPCVQGGKFVGLSKYAGIKQKRMRLIADEAASMGESFLSAFANLNKNADFRAIVIGNPNDPLDPLGRAAEPEDGWTQHLEPTKTTVWKTRFMNGACVNLVGLDSPNFDFPEDQPTRYKYLISREKIADTLSFFPKDSIEYYSQCVGVMKIGMLSRRVLTRDMCRTFGALGAVIWEGAATTKIGALDASYGGDRCVGGHIEFGKEVGGKVVIRIHPPQIVPIRPNSEKIPEDQISEWVKNYCTQHGVPPENFFHDSTGRGTLGTSLARIWSNLCNPVEFGVSPTDRPVSLNLYIYDQKLHQRRLKTCKEHYLKFVTELWFSVRYAVESGQIREMPTEVMDEFCMREWDKRMASDKIELETKELMKARVGRSPDLADWLAIAVEGGRRRGFQIDKLGGEELPSDKYDWLKTFKQRNNSMRVLHALNYST